MSTDIVKAVPAGLDMVGSLAEVERMAKLLMGASGYIPAGLRSPGQVAAVILAGRELGVPPMAALRNFFLIEGKLGMDASFVLGRMLAAGVTIKWLRNDAEAASVTLTRAGCDPYTSTFTKEDAVRAELWNKGTWKKYPAAMLRARAITAGARAYAPDVFAGSVYTAEELRGGDEEPAQAAPVHVVAEAAPDAAYQQALGYLDAATSADEIAEIRANVVKPLWASLDKAQRLEVEAAAKNAKARVSAGGVREGEIVDEVAAEIVSS